VAQLEMRGFPLLPLIAGDGSIPTSTKLEPFARLENQSRELACLAVYCFR
jgi:hypothetical protein